ncbi:hypothetical protein POUND7_003899 [Theobroma cacao]
MKLNYNFHLGFFWIFFFLKKSFGFLYGSIFHLLQFWDIVIFDLNFYLNFICLFLLLPWTTLFDD